MRQRMLTCYLMWHVVGGVRHYVRLHKCANFAAEHVRRTRNGWHVLARDAATAYVPSLRYVRLMTHLPQGSRVADTLGLRDIGKARRQRYASPCAARELLASGKCVTTPPATWHVNLIRKGHRCLHHSQRMAGAVLAYMLLSILARPGLLLRTLKTQQLRTHVQGWYLILFPQNTAAFRPRSGAKIRGFYRI